MRLRVRRVSIRPMQASRNAYGKIIFNVSKPYVMSGILNDGIDPAIDPKSPTVFVSKSRKITRHEIITIEARDDGIPFVNFGNK